MLFTNNHIIAYDSRRLTVPAELAGGKAKNLFHLIRRGFNVPPWLVVSTEVFTKSTKPIAQEISDTIESINFSKQASIESASKKICDLISRQSIPNVYIKQINNAVLIKLPVGVKYSIRSSVVGEDSNSNSFAGQMDSFLNVSYPNIIESVKKVWASAYSLRALLYRHQKGLDFRTLSVAVIIQKMVNASMSGIMFTRSPQSGAEEIHISAGFGLGEGVVQDIVEIDSYRVGWNSNQINKQVRRKKVRIIPDSTDGTRLQLIETTRQNVSVLSDNQVRMLCKYGIKAEKKFGRPQDIEWAFNSTGELFILQTRPIVQQKSTHSQYRIWDNSNIVESYPGITLPLTFSFIQQGYEIAFKKAALDCLLIKSEVKRDLHIFQNMIGLLDGRVYYNLLNWYKMLSYLPGYKNHKKAWDQMIGINKAMEFPRTRLSWVNRLFSIAVIICRLLTVKRTANSFFRKFNRSYDKYKDIKFASLNENDLIELYYDIRRDFSPTWHLTLYNDFCAMKYYDWLKKLCNIRELRNNKNLHNNLLCGQPDLESVRPVHALLEMASILRGSSAYRKLFATADYGEIWIEIITNPQYSALKKRLSDYLKVYGDRGMEELKLERPTYKDNPKELLKLIHDYSRGDLTATSMSRHQKFIRQSAENTVRKNLRNPLKRLLFQFVLFQARRSIANRENMRFARSRLYGIVKKLFRTIGRLFCEQKIISNAEDIYYLTVSEIFSYIEGSSVNQNLNQIIQIRKADYTSYKNHSLRECIQSSGIPYLSGYRQIEGIKNKSKILKGIGCSSGVTSGIARVVTDAHEPVNEKEYILIAKSTDPGWVFLMIQSKGIVVEKGSVLSHTAIIGRELGIPTIVAVDKATSSICNGDIIRIDGSTGVVQCA